MILERNYLDVYPYENWNSKNIHYYEVGQTFHPTILDIEESQTSPPNLLTEADLIALMEKHGIGNIFYLLSGCILLLFLFFLKTIIFELSQR